MASSQTRILFLCHDGTLYGAQKSLQLLVTHLPRERYRIFVSFARPGQLLEHLQALPEVTVLRHGRVPWVKHVPRSWLQKVGDLFTLFLSLPRAVRLALTIRRLGIDVVHTNSLVSLEGALAARLAGVPHVWHIREFFAEPSPRFNLVLGRWLTRILVHYGADQVACISRYVQDQFAAFSKRRPERYVHLPNAIALPETTNLLPRSNKSQTGKLQMIYLGRVSDGKRFQDLLEACAILKTDRQIPLPFTVHVYGDFICPEFEAFVRRRLAETGLSADMHLHGHQADVVPLIRQADLLVAPCSREPFGRTMLEAMAEGVPVVAPNAGGALEVITDGETGFFYTADDPHSLARCLIQVCEVRDCLPRMQAACRERVQTHFDVRHQIRQLTVLYQDVLQRQPLRGRSCDEGISPAPHWHGA